MRPNAAKEVIKSAIEAGMTISVYDPHDGEDYRGDNLEEAWEAVEACDEMHVKILDEDKVALGWMLVIPGLEPDETVADYSGAFIEEVLGKLGA